MNNQYALAFFQIAKEDNVLESCKESFEVLIEVLKNDLEFSRFLISPKIKTSEKQNFLKKVLFECEQDFLYFLYVLLDNNRIGEIDEIFKSFSEGKLSGLNNALKIIFSFLLATSWC